MSQSQATAPSEATYTEEMRSVLARAQAGDPAVLPALRELLDRRPELWREFGDLAWHAQQALLGLAGGRSLLARESIGRRLAELKADVGGADPSPLEKLLTERVALCWLHLHLAELDVAALRQKAQPAGLQGREAQQRLDRAHQRYLSAIKQLAVTGRLLKPAPSPLDMLRVPVGETTGASSRSRRGADSPLCGAGTEN